jgi:predicted nuclease with TOPRIM domain
MRTFNEDEYREDMGHLKDRIEELEKEKGNLERRLDDVEGYFLNFVEMFVRVQEGAALPEQQLKDAKETLEALCPASVANK